MRARTIAYIFQTIETLERELALLKALVQQSISEEAIEQDNILADAEYIPEETDQEILVDAEIIEDDTKPPAKPTSRREQRLEGRRRAKEWAKMLSSYKKGDNSNTTS
jgi:hypothetical protein